MKYTVLVGDRVYEIRLGANQTVEVNGDTHQVDFNAVDEFSIYSLLLDNHSWEALLERVGDEYRISVGGELFMVTVQDERTRKIAKALSKPSGLSGEVTIRAPMPGLVRGVPAEAGQEVQAGQGLIILEAMKMENELRAPRAGRVHEVRVKPGDAVEQGQPLVILK